jgi:tetratricopeptide (TPR) repeat protein
MEPEQNIAELMRAANGHLDRGEFQMAALLYLRVLEQDPAQAAAANNLAVCYERLGHPREAEQTLVAALWRLPGSAFLRFRLGSLYASQGRLAEAEEQLRAAVSCDPNGPAARQAAAALESFQRPTEPIVSCPASVGPIDIISEGFDLWLHNLHIMSAFTLFLFLIGVAPVLLTSKLQDIQFDPQKALSILPQFAVAMPFIIVLQAFLSLLLILFIDSTARGEHFELSTLTSRTAGRFVPFLLASFAIGFATSVGMLFCFIPGIILMARYFCLKFFVALDGQSVGDASMNSVKAMERNYGTWAVVMLLTIAMFGIAAGFASFTKVWGSQLAAQVLTQFFTSVLMTLAVVFQVVMFHDFKRTVGMDNKPAQDTTTPR